MTKDLYFIPILMKALDEPDRATALATAFETIIRLGETPEHKKGYEQFELFMDEVANSATRHVTQLESQLGDAIQLLMLELATDTFCGSETDREGATRLIMSLPEWKGQYEALLKETLEDSQKRHPIEVILERDQRIAHALTFKTIPAFGYITGITPGHYRIRLGGGRVLWDGQIEENDVIWSSGLTDQEPLKVAADTGEEKAQPTRELRLLEDTVLVHVYPGVNAGRIQIELRRGDAGQDGQ